MGLDIYLRSCQNKALADQKEKEYEEFSNSLWDEFKDIKYENIPEADKERIQKLETEKKVELGITDYHHNSINEIKLDSTKYPMHYFKIGYFRSSYNSGGINSVLEKFGIKDLYYIFEPNNEYEFKPDWNSARIKTLEIIEKLKLALQSPKGKFDVEFEASAAMHEIAHGDEEALNMFLKVNEEYKNRKDICNFSNSKGVFYLRGIKVHALIRGTQYGQQGLYYIFKVNPKDREWYVEALEIVLETIDWVLAQDNKEEFYLTWSS